jgi:hypothetical protein
MRTTTVFNEYLKNVYRRPKCYMMVPQATVDVGIIHPCWVWTSWFNRQIKRAAREGVAFIQRPKPCLGNCDGKLNMQPGRKCDCDFLNSKQCTVNFETLNEKKM